MHPADTCADTCAHPASRSPQLVRLLLLVAFGVGLLGLNTSGGPRQLPTVVATSAAAHSSLTTETGDLPVRRASRSAAGRSAIAATTRPAVGKAPLRKASVRKAAVRRAAVRRPAWARPSGAGVVSGYGMRWGRMHKGIDFGAHSGDQIRAVGDGVVVGTGYLGSEGGYGKITIIRHAGGVYSAYAHQSRVAVHAGERVTAGEVIGYVGSTGHSTGPHLHFEIRMAPHGGQVNPLRWLRAHRVFI